MATINRSIKVQEDFYAAVKEYQQARGYKSWTQALVELTAIGIDRVAGVVIKPHGKWGGDHNSAAFREQAASIVEHLDVELLGLPPLADDD